MDLRKINRFRRQINARGFMRKIDLQRYIGCGYTTANRIWNEIIEMKKSQGEEVSPLGIKPEWVMSYMNITKEEINEYAKEGM